MRPAVKHDHSAHTWPPLRTTPHKQPHNQAEPWRHRCAAVLAGMALIVGGPAAMAQDTSLGAQAFNACLACHAVGPAAQNKTGPVLNGISGKPAGVAADFAYSEAFKTAKASGLVWSDENLDAYLTDPATFVPGSRMAWAVPVEAQRRAIIAYLKSLP